jgi:hypothetical protein
MSIKEKRNIHAATRMTKSEYAEFLLKNINSEGLKIISESEFIRQALLKSEIKVIDSEVEQYKCFILGKISNNINQLSRRLNEDNQLNKISENTYKEVLSELVKLNESIFKLSSSVS